jgi:DNA repair exonuclease SbcCD ATPase subunit
MPPGYRPPEDSIESLKRANDDLYDKIAARDAQVDRLNKRISDLSEADKSRELNVANLQSEVDQWHQDREDYERRLQEAYRDAEEAKEEVQRVNKRADNIESLFNSTQSQLDDTNESLRKAREDLDNAVNYNEQLEISLGEFERQAAELQSKADYYDDAHAFMERINRVAEPTFTEMGWEVTPANIIEHFENISKPQLQRIRSDTSLHSNTGEPLKISRPKPGNRKVSIADELPPSDDEMDIDGPEINSEDDEQTKTELHGALQRVAEPEAGAEVNDLREKITALNDECQTYRKQITELEVQAKSDSAKITGLKKENGELAQDIGKLKSSSSKPDTQAKPSAETIVLRKLTEKNQALLDQVAKADGVAKELKAFQEKEKTMLQQIRTEEERVAALQQKEKTLLEQISAEQKTVEELKGKEKKLLQQISAERKESSTKIEQLESRIAANSEQTLESPGRTETGTDQSSSKITKLETRIAVLQAEHKKMANQIASGETANSKLKREHELEMEKMEKSKKTLLEQKNKLQESAAAKIKDLQKRVETSTAQNNGKSSDRIVTVTRQRQPDLLEWWSEAPFWMHVLLCVLITLLFFGTASSWMIRHAWVKANDPILEHLRTLRFVDEPSTLRVWLESALGVQRTYLG